MVNRKKNITEDGYMHHQLLSCAVLADDLNQYASSQFSSESLKAIYPKCQMASSGLQSYLDSYVQVIHMCVRAHTHTHTHTHTRTNKHKFYKS